MTSAIISHHAQWWLMMADRVDERLQEEHSLSDLSQLPSWTPIWTDDGYIYEALDSNGRAWRLWFVKSDSPDDPFPRGWRFAPIDALDQVNFFEHLGGGRAFDLAAMRIDARNRQ